MIDNEINLEDENRHKNKPCQMCQMCPCMMPGMYNPNMMSNHQMGYQGQPMMNQMGYPASRYDEYEDDEDFDENDYRRRRRPHGNQGYNPYFNPLLWWWILRP